MQKATGKPSLYRMGRQKAGEVGWFTTEMVVITEKLLLDGMELEDIVVITEKLLLHGMQLEDWMTVIHTTEFSLMRWTK